MPGLRSIEIRWSDQYLATAGPPKLIGEAEKTGVGTKSADFAGERIELVPIV